MIFLCIVSIFILCNVSLSYVIQPQLYEIIHYHVHCYSNQDYSGSSVFVGITMYCMGLSCMINLCSISFVPLCCLIMCIFHYNVGLSYIGQ